MHPIPGDSAKSQSFVLNRRPISQKSCDVDMRFQLLKDTVAMPIKPAPAGRQPATRADFHRILGSLDDPKIIDILKLNPTVSDLEQAAICVAGDQDTLAKGGHRVSSVAVRVAEIIAAEEEEADRTPPPSPEA
ncbi:MAG: hypothetical protein JSR91_28485 [Proteobacteria bacterium]|nr:hypothetical protein [Pseudomonadota bacterium]